jgi:hypothetical protein
MRTIRSASALMFSALSLAAGAALVLYILRIAPNGSAQERVLAEIPPNVPDGQGSRKGATTLGESATPENSRLLQLEERIGRLTKGLDDLAAIVNANKSEQGVAELRAPPLRSTAPARKDPELQSMREQANLSRRFATESAVSQWGQSVKAALDQQLSTRATPGELVGEGSQFNSDCRETVCTVSWSAGPSQHKTAEEISEILDRARFELMSTAGVVEDMGLVRFDVDSDPAHPSISMYFEPATSASTPIVQEGGGTPNTKAN